MIPENKQAAVKKALQNAFDINKFESIELLTKGLSSALIFKIIIRGKPYLLRVITRTDAMADPTNHYACMKIAAEKALAPSIHYLSIEDRIAITDFINEHPFPIHEAKEKMPSLLQQLHAVSKFPPPRNNYFDIMKGFVTKLRTSHIVDESVTKDLFKAYEYIEKIYPFTDEENLVSCHNDAKPENIIFDGQRPWLVDWEAAFLNDRYLDLAVVANFVVKNDKDEIDFLEKYFGESINEYRHARFFLMKQLLHVFYFAFLTCLVSEGKPVDVNSITKYDFRDFHDRMWINEITLKGNDTRLAYAWLHKEQFIYNVQLKRFEDSLRIIAAHNKFS